MAGNVKTNSALLNMMRVISIVVMCWSNAAISQELVEYKLVGAWEIFKDDERPGEKISSEIMNFWPDGRFNIMKTPPASVSHIGNYKVNDKIIYLLVKKGSAGFTVQLNYSLSGSVIKIKNKKVGWVYYKRVSNKPLGVAPVI